MEPLKTQNCQSNTEAKGQSWKHRPSITETILQSYSNQNSMVLAQKETYGSMEQKREPRIKFIFIWVINLQQKGQEYTRRKQQPVQNMVLGKLDSYVQKHQNGLLFITYVKINSKWIKGLNVNLKP